MQMPHPTHFTQSVQNRPFTFGGNPTIGAPSTLGSHTTFGNRPTVSQSTFCGTPVMGCIMKPPPQVIKNDDDSEDDFPVQQSGPLVDTSQSTRHGATSMGMGIQFGQIKSNQMLYTQLKEMRTRVEQTNGVIDSFYQILSMPNELTVNQVDQIYIQIEMMRNNNVANNVAINEIFRIIVKN